MQQINLTVDSDELLNGGIMIVEGMKYHAYNYLKFEYKLGQLNQKGKSKRTKELFLKKRMKFEVIAYFNQMGRFYYFTNSKRVKQLVKEPKSHIPNIERYLDFRMKQAAHRATDQPKENDPYEQTNYMEQLDRWFSHSDILVDGRMLFQLLRPKLKGDKPTTLNFILHKEHSTILEECESILDIINDSSIKKRKEVKFYSSNYEF